MPDNQIAVPETKKETKKSFLNICSLIFLEFLSITFWSYIVVKLFVYDVDNYIINQYLPNYGWLITYKFLIILFAIAIVWLFIRAKKIITWTLYILFYPFILIFWKFPKAVYKKGNWNVGIAIVNALFAFFKSFKYNIITFSLLTVSSILILSTSSKIIIISSSIILSVILLTIFINRFVLVFKPSLIYKIHIKTVTLFINFSKKTWAIDDELKALAINQMSDTQLQKWSLNLQIMILGNKFCYFLSSKLNNYQKSKITIIFNVFSIAILLFFSVLCFTLINLGIYKVWPELYSGSSVKPGFFSFFYYSFNTFHFSNVTELVPISDLSRTISVIEQFFAIFLVSIFITLLLSVKNEREASDIQQVVEEIRQQGDDMGTFIQDQYNLSVELAIKELQKLNAGLLKLVLRYLKT
ncbi:hypothetical protein [uncultured Mucilaginibacter sp.]|uniref:hypothetical protein n=1 Tax=uncultured Mucilaginibacter sp. TaxID=797541 RepID=UPI00260026C7|nr:hypothetical protein [uncultured Mucilaginibacter sp.]